jgi:hypothetical protein
MLYVPGYVMGCVRTAAADRVMPPDIAPAPQGAQGKPGSPILEICSVKRINVSLNGLYACTESNGKHSRDILCKLAPTSA